MYRLNKDAIPQFLPIVFLFFLSLGNGQFFYAQTEEETSGIGQLRLPESESVTTQYRYDPLTDRYIFIKSIADYPITTPLVLTPEEFEARVLQEELKSYFRQKTVALAGKAENLEDTQKNLLPELYVNKQFFQSIFGNNSIDIEPQGAIGIDLGGRYQSNENPAASPRNRESFGFDFDQRISLSLLGKIGDRLQITANYDTESTFDFQNLIKIQFNPPQINELVSVNNGRLIEQAQELKEKFDDAKEKLNQAKQKIDEYKQKLQQLKTKANSVARNPLAFGNDVADYLEGNFTEDGIIQNIDLGNVSMPLNNSLIQGAQSLFGVRADLKFGKTTITGIFSEQRSQSQNISAQGGGTLSTFDLFALDYEEDRHFFLAQFFREQYDEALKTYPYINSKAQITRIEVWVTNRGAQTNNIRNIVALQDLGEALPNRTALADRIPDFFTAQAATQVPNNEANRLNPKSIGSTGVLNEAIRDIATVQQGFGNYAATVQEGIDFAVLESARKLNPNEYQLHPQLGYISLNQRLSNDEVLGVAFQFTYQGKLYQVGEFANGGVPGTTVASNAETTRPQVQTNNLVVKLLKSNLTDIRQPIWDLMMKNIYNSGAFQIDQEDFRLTVLWSDPSPINYLTPVDTEIWPEDLEEQILLNTFALDRLDNYQDPAPKGDGFFDYIPGITIDPKFGRIIFPSVEPFGHFLFDLLRDLKNGQEDYHQPNTYNANQKRYVFREMYTLTKAAALEETEKNKFQLKGRYKSQGGEGIPIGAFNVPRGSVQVTAGGRLLQEGVDYTVNYDIGRVKILDEALLAANIPIDISVENNSFFNQQNKRFSGVNVQHQVSENAVVGASLINLSENPLTQKANYGTAPVNNTMLGFNTNFSTEVPLLTRLANVLPNIDTTAPSRLSFRGEIASLQANNPRNTQLEGEANVYIDDFEGAQTSIDIKGFNAWSLSSTPVKHFEGSAYTNNDLRSGFGRAKLAWYTIDPIFFTSQRPSGINNNDISLNTTRRIFIQEIFPEQDLVQGTSTVQNTFDLAYYPDEKGPYNNNEETVFETNPKKNWAGIMRPLSATNFEQSNVEFIEFWLLDTFENLEEDENDEGELVFHLGNISEDVLKDGRKQYENGLPGAANESLINTTVWGKVPAKQSLLYAFNTTEADRELQDVGLDGLTDTEEQAIYTNGPAEDPAGDNYQYFVAAQGGVLERYKNYNGTDGNSPIAFSNTDRGSTTIPDTEDINRDQSMNTIDSYFEYRVPIFKSMTVGNHPFITDVRENVKVRVPNGQEITTRWIQFKVPIQKNYYSGTTFSPYFDAVNAIEDLRSIRFMRMALTGFSSPVVFRFGTLELVRGDWRRYNKPLNPDLPMQTNTTVDISTVNILENENRIPINYVLPPDIRREQVNNNNTIVRQNEQSLAFRVNELQPQDARGIYKPVDLDMRQYKKLRMFLHAESLQGKPELPGSGATEDYDNRLVAFIRLGTDYQDNYYQIEVPLQPTPFDSEGSNRLSPEEVWQPDANSIEVPLELLSKIKALALGQASFQNPLYFDEELNPIQEFTPISALPGAKKYKFSIKGNPSLGNIKTLMIGVKNPATNIGNVLSGEVWFNELRLSGIDSEGGWAAIGALDANIADFAKISATGRYSTIGFGALDQSPNQRSREEMLQYDMVSNVNLGQLLPNKWGLQLPMNFGVGETIITPEYDPFYEDLKLDERLETASRPSQRDSIRNQAIDYTRRKSISFIGVRKTSSGGKKRFYKPENFDFSYAYNENFHQDYEIADQKEVNLMLQANYGYNFQPVEVMPFRKVKSLSRKKYWEWLWNFNFNLLPSTVAVTSNINRALRRQQFREVYFEGVDPNNQIALPDLMQRNYLFDWSYTLNHNLTKSLRLTVTASTNNIVKEYFKTKDENNTGLSPKEETVWENLWDGGQSNNFFQKLSLNYKLPLQYIPFLSFIDANYNYTGDFNWQRGADALAEVESPSGIPLGIVHTVQNANTKTLTGAINFNRLYTLLGLSGGQSRFVRPRRAADQPKTSPAKAEEENKKKRSKKTLKRIVDVLATIKRIQFNYAENNGTVLPGYLPGVGFTGTTKPTMGFTFGSQADVRYAAARQGWLTQFPDFNQPFTQVHNAKLILAAQWAPVKDFIVDFNAERTYSESTFENFRVENQEYVPLNSTVAGNFGMSTILIKTAFNRLRGVTNPSFEVFRANRFEIARRMARERGLPLDGLGNEGYPKGLGKDQQDVIIAAFLSAYTDTATDKIGLSPIQKTPLPNWNLKYGGLRDIPMFKKVFRRFTLTHAYRASMTINNFQTNLDYDPNNPLQLDDAGNFVSEQLYSNINLVEQFNPLLRVDAEFSNSLRVLAELKRDRAFSLSLDNNLLTETSGSEYIVGLGYRIKDLRLRTNLGGKRTTLKGDLNLKADFSYRNNLTILRNLEYNDNQVTAGQTLMSLKITADYALSKNLTSLFFYDHNFSRFGISTAFPQTSIRSGFTIRYNFGN